MPIFLDVTLNCIEFVINKVPTLVFSLKDCG